MTPKEATAEVFLKAFLGLPAESQNAFIGKLLQHRAIREDIIDLAIAEDRSKEKTSPFHQVVSEIRKSRSPA